MMFHYVIFSLFCKIGNIFLLSTYYLLIFVSCKILLSSISYNLLSVFFLEKIVIFYLLHLSHLSFGYLLTTVQELSLLLAVVVVLFICQVVTSFLCLLIYLLSTVIFWDHVGWFVNTFSLVPLWPSISQVLIRSLRWPCIEQATASINTRLILGGQRHHVESSDWSRQGAHLLSTNE